MKTAFAGRLVALTMLAGLLTAAFPIHAEPVEAAMPSQADEACAGQSAAQPDRSSDERLATPVFPRTESERDVLGAALGSIPLSLGERAAPSGCSPRHCQPDAVFVGCCGRFRILGYDSRGECTVRQLCARD